MASTDLKHRKTTEEDSQPPPKRPAKNMAMAKRGLKSLALAVSIPISLTLLAIFFLSNPNNASASPVKPFWFPSTAAINFGFLASSFLMGVSAWLVWADGGFHATPNALYLYTLYVLLCLLWYGLVLGAGAGRLGSVACLGKTVALVGCHRLFRRVNPIAADLIKPSLAWSLFLTVVSLTMISL